MAALNFLSGVTEHNKESVIQGQLDIPLSNDGIIQAKLLGDKLEHFVWKEVYHWFPSSYFDMLSFFCNITTGMV